MQGASSCLAALPSQPSPRRKWPEGLTVCILSIPSELACWPVNDSFWRWNRSIAVILKQVNVFSISRLIPNIITLVLKKTYSHLYACVHICVYMSYLSVVPQKPGLASLDLKLQASGLNETQFLWKSNQYCEPVTRLSRPHDLISLTHISWRMQRPWPQLQPVSQGSCHPLLPSEENSPGLTLVLKTLARNPCQRLGLLSRDLYQMVIPC